MKNKNILYLALGIGAGYIAFHFLCKKKKTLFAKEKKLNEIDNSIPESNNEKVSTSEPVKTEKVIAVVDKTTKEIITIPQDSTETKPLKQNEGLALINVPVLGESVGTATAIGSAVNTVSAIEKGTENTISFGSPLGLSASPIVATLSANASPVSASVISTSPSLNTISVSPLAANLSAYAMPSVNVSAPITKNIPLEKISSSNIKSQFDGCMKNFELGSVLTDI